MLFFKSCICVRIRYVGWSEAYSWVRFNLHCRSARSIHTWPQGSSTLRIFSPSRAGLSKLRLGSAMMRNLDYNWRPIAIGTLISWTRSFGHFAADGPASAQPAVHACFSSGSTSHLYATCPQRRSATNIRPAPKQDNLQPLTSSVTVNPMGNPQEVCYIYNNKGRCFRGQRCPYAPYTVPPRYKV